MFYPHGIYSSRHYAIKAAKNKGYLRFKIARLMPYNSFKSDHYEIFRACEDEFGNQDPSLGYYLMEEGK
jgi:hypothetical protein